MPGGDGLRLLRCPLFYHAREGILNALPKLAEAGIDGAAAGAYEFGAHPRGDNAAQVAEFAERNHISVLADDAENLPLGRAERRRRGLAQIAVNALRGLPNRTSRDGQRAVGIDSAPQAPLGRSGGILRILQRAAQLRAVGFRRLGAADRLGASLRRGSGSIDGGLGRGLDVGELST